MVCLYCEFSYVLSSGLLNWMYGDISYNSMVYLHSGSSHGFSSCLSAWMSWDRSYRKIVFSLLWVLSCVVNSAVVLNVFVQSWHILGVSPLCIIWCTFKSLADVNTLLQVVQEYFLFFRMSHLILSHMNGWMFIFLFW